MRIWTTTATAALLSAGAPDTAVSRIPRDALPCS